MQVTCDKNDIMGESSSARAASKLNDSPEFYLLHVQAILKVLT